MSQLRPTRRRIPLTASLLVSVGLVAASCSGGSDRDSADVATSDTIEPAEQTITEAASAPAAVVSPTIPPTTVPSTTEPPITEPPAEPEPDDDPVDQPSAGGRPASPTGNEVAFQSGDDLSIGIDIVPGVYIAQAGTAFCSWDLTHADGEIASNIYPGQIILEISADDDAFSADADCGTWEPYVIPDSPVQTIGEGHWAVGQQILPGIYRTDAEVIDFCYWERASGFKLSVDEIIENDIVDIESSSGERQPEVTILETDARFVTDGCGSWTLVS